jgi:aryl-alcohol dehydrogenase-like predicted oxidoreductase
MKKRKLGSQGLEVAELGLGCMGMSDFYGKADEAESVATIHRALELGVTLLDTADIYGFGDNERLVGRAIQGRRDRVVLATKFGILRRKEDSAYRGVSGKPDYVKQSCEGSLKRLGVDVIDLYYIHRVDRTVPIEDTVGAMSELVAAGKVRFIGISEAGPDTIRRAHRVHPLSALQTEYSLWSRDPEDRLLPLAWVLAQGDVVVPIPGTTRRRHLEENIAAADLTLSPKEMARIDATAHRKAASGDRYADMNFVNIEAPPK